MSTQPRFIEPNLSPDNLQPQGCDPLFSACHESDGIDPEPNVGQGCAGSDLAHAKQPSNGIVDLAQVTGPAPESEVLADITDSDGSTKNLEQKSFADFGISPAICQALSAKGINYPFPIQALTLPVALSRHDIIGQAKTGTGKTLGFGLPVLEDVCGPGEEGYDSLLSPGAPQALIVVPTRELAKQVANDLSAAAANRRVRIAQIYGGVAFEPQLSQLKAGVEVVVGTPGRLIDLLKRSILVLNSVRTLVLDEADEMLDLGFLPDVETLLSRTPHNRHTMLFSATMPGQVVALARRYMTQPTHIRAQDPSDQGATVKTVKQVVYRCHALNKTEVVARLLQARGRGLTIIFTRTKRTCARVCEELNTRGFAAAALHGDLGQGAREQAMRAFRHGKVDILVATDVAARGIDVDDVTHVINFQCPEDEKVYLHRIGRTGRAGACGTAVTFVDWDDIPRWRLVDKALGLGVADPVETYHTSPHLFADLDIPAGVGPKLPQGKRLREGLQAEAIEDLGETGRRTPQNRTAAGAKSAGGAASRRTLRSGKRVRRHGAGRRDSTSEITQDNRDRRPRRRRGQNAQGQ